MDIKEQQGARKALLLIKEIRKQAPELQVQAAQAFLEVVLDEGITVTRLAEKLGIALSTASRNAALLSDVHRSGQPGLGWVHKGRSADDSRAIALTLTPRGRRVSEGLIHTITGD